MKKALTIGFSGAAVAAALSFAATSLKTESPVVSEARATEAEQASGPIVVAQVMNYERGPRIIIVPQSGDRMDRGSRASIDRAIEEDDYDAAVARRTAVPPPVRTQPRWGAQPKTPPMEIAPRRAETPAKPRADLHSDIRSAPRKVRHIDMSKPKAEPKEEAELPIPQPPSPRRAVLSAPPLPAEGPSPIKPTPKFDSKADPKLGARAESTAPFAEPSPAVGETPPPAEITADQPPPGYTPPAGMLRDEAGNKY